ncbi:MAG TPA: hypothetical protein VG294_07775 [Solirubrobacteraceae bacterium]|nr:hypothetical protein [Solirubrobacteraceae bacterium]
MIDPPAWPAPPGAPRLKIRVTGLGGSLYVRSSEVRHRPAKLLGARG